MIVEVGSVNVDYIIHIDRAPRDGETVSGKSVTVMAGGKGANQIAAAARLGADTEFLAKVGELDNNNNMLMDDFKWAGVSTDCIEIEPDVYTGSAYCMIDKDAQNSIIIIEGANAAVTPEFVKSHRDLIKDANLVVCEFSIPQETVDYTMKLAKQLGVTTICNPAPFREVDKDFYKNVDIITPNEIEAAEICGFEVNDEESASKASDYLHSLGIDKVVITLGDRGAFCSDGKKKEMINSYKVKAVDTTGAGDSFNGAFAYALDRGYDFFEAARFANAAASQSVQRLGSMRSLPNLEETETVYKLS